METSDLTLQIDQEGDGEFEDTLAPTNIEDLSADLFFPQIAIGDSILSDIYLINNSQEQTKLSTEFYDADGEALIEIEGTDDSPFGRLTLNPAETRKFSLSGTGPAKAFALRVQADSDEEVFGNLLIKIFGEDQIISEVGVLDSPVISDFGIIQDSLDESITGIALFNPHASAIDVRLSLFNQDGLLMAEESIRLGAQSHFAKFTSEIFELNSIDEMLGTIWISSSSPVSAVTLRMNGLELTSFPVLRSRESSKTVIFPQIAAGPEFVSFIYLHNSTTSPTSGTIRLFDDDGNAMSLDSISGSSLSWHLEPGKVKRIALSDDSLNVGWAIVTTNTPGATLGTALFQWIKPTGQVVTQAGVLPARSTMAFSVIGSSEEAARTGIAVANPNDASSLVKFELFDSEGNQVGEAFWNMRPKGHRARFLDELFPAVPEISRLVATSNRLVNAVTIRVDGVEFTTFPILP